MMPELQTITNEQQMNQEDGVRARTYALLGNLLARAPDAAMLDLLRGIEAAKGDGKDMAAAWATLRLAAEQAHAEGVAEEYFNLFIGIGRGELVPYGSWYLTGFLLEQPLALLRNDLAALGFERQAGVHEPEDHAAALCEVMSLLIDGSDEGGLTVQRTFFQRHLAPWMGRFFADLQRAEGARFYRAVGLVGERFLEIESQYLVLPA